MANTKERWKGIGFFGLTTLAGCLCLLGPAACKSGPQTDQQITQEAAQITKLLKADVRQTVAEAKTTAIDAKVKMKDLRASVRESMTARTSGPVSPKTVNINYASEASLATLPGINSARARKIANNRPYNTPQDMVTKGVLTRSEFARLAGRVVAWDN
jgi:DNA uptake protein ComE-like DNA-binding protein